MPMASIVDEVQNYPIEKRAVIADAVLQTLNQIDPETQKEWSRVAQKRRAELMDGKVCPIATSEVMAEAYSRAVR